METFLDIKGFHSEWIAITKYIEFCSLVHDILAINSTYQKLQKLWSYYCNRLSDKGVESFLDLKDFYSQ